MGVGSWWSVMVVTWGWLIAVGGQWWLDVTPCFCWQLLAVVVGG